MPVSHIMTQGGTETVVTESEIPVPGELKMNASCDQKLCTAYQLDGSPRGKLAFKVAKTQGWYPIQGFKTIVD